VYAFARSASKTFKNRYLLSDIGKLQYFTLTLEDYYLNRLKNNIFFRVLFKLRKAQWVDMLDGSTDFTSHMPDLRGNKRIAGYFQSENYFKSVEGSIRKAFTIKPVYRQRFEKKYKPLFINNYTVVIHIRRTDYESHVVENLGVGSFILPDTYYETVLHQINTPEKLLIFISDDIAYVKRKFQHIQNAVFSGEDEITDLQILMHADVCVISNSTFSWWGAWLNSKKSKVVYAPEFFLGFKVNKEYPVNILPPGWIKVNVYNTYSVANRS
jgi:hypothetical protein